MKNKRSTYRYEPLDSAPGKIRLLTVLPRSESTTKATLQQVSLDDIKGQFDAVSYTWGTQDPCRHIIVNGRKLQVRQNIWSCLKHMRQHKMFSKPLWIDSICIDQENDTEKAHQVAAMSRIFSSARIVYVWLGITSRSFQPECNKGHALLDSAISDLPDSALLEEIIKRQDRVAFAAVDHLMRLVYDEYWHRLWIVQETTLASNPRVILGNMLLGVGKLSLMLFLIREASKPVYYKWLQRLDDSTFQDRGTGILDNHPIYSMKAQWNGIELAELIIRYRQKLCTIPQDHIYGLLGLTNSRTCPKVDYEGSVEVLLMETIRCLHAEAIDARSQKSKGPGMELLTRPVWTVACAMQCLKTSSRNVQNAIGTSSALSQYCTRSFEMTIQPFEVIVPCASAHDLEEGVTPEELLCTSIREPNGQIEHYWKCHTWFGPHMQKQFWRDPRGIPLLICSVETVHPFLLLSINTDGQVRVEKFVAFDVTHKAIPLSYVQYRSREIPENIAQNLNDRLNTLKVNWQNVFHGEYFSQPFHMSYIELVELAETYDLQADTYDPMDRYGDWRMTYEIQGQEPNVAQIVQVLKSTM